LVFKDLLVARQDHLPFVRGLLSYSILSLSSRDSFEFLRQFFIIDGFLPETLVDIIFLRICSFLSKTCALSTKKDYTYY